jgi:hypothetical protein
LCRDHSKEVYLENLIFQLVVDEPTYYNPATPLSAVPYFITIGSLRIFSLAEQVVCSFTPAPASFSPIPYQSKRIKKKAQAA